MPANDLFQLQDRNVLVVGGGLGMGRASALLLSSVGANVAVLDIDETRAMNVVSEIAATGGNAVPVTADVLDAEAGAGAVREASKKLGGLHVLVNIVGMAEWGSLLEITHETFDRELSRNLRYVFTVCQAFARLSMPEGTPRSIVSIASISGFNSAPRHASYGAAKAGLMSLTRTMANEWGPLGIRVNCIAPGAIRTDRSQRAPGQMSLPVPLGRVGDQTEIAKAALFLASDLASYVTGHALLVDGGSLTNYPFPISR